MNCIPGSDRGELLLLPEAPEDSIAPETPVRVSEVFLAQLDVAKAGFTNAQLKCLQYCNTADRAGGCTVLGGGNRSYHSGQHQVWTR